jgi:hypothetical protein
LFAPIQPCELLEAVRGQAGLADHRHGHVVDQAQVLEVAVDLERQVAAPASGVVAMPMWVEPAACGRPPRALGRPWWRRWSRRRLPAFSTTTLAPPSGLRIASARSRATLSVGPPAAKGTISVMGLPPGNACAWAPAAARAAPAMAAILSSGDMVSSCVQVKGGAW